MLETKDKTCSTCAHWIKALPMCELDRTWSPGDSTCKDWLTLESKKYITIEAITPNGGA